MQYREYLCFVLDQTGVSVPMAMLWFHNTQDIDIRRCEFIQVYLRSQKDPRMTSILAESGKPPATLRVKDSCFLGFGSSAPASKDGKEDMVFLSPASGGQDAITRRGAVRIEQTNCLYGPHAAVLRLEGAAPEESRLVQMKHCTVLAGNSSAVYDVADGADARIEARFSLFSSAGETRMMEMDTGNTAVLLVPCFQRGTGQLPGIREPLLRFELPRRRRRAAGNDGACARRHAHQEQRGTGKVSLERSPTSESLEERSEFFGDQSCLRGQCELIGAACPHPGRGERPAHRRR